MKSDLPPVPHDGLASADLTVGRVYRGGPQPHVGADPLHTLVGVGNSGGFRTKTVKATGATALCVLFATGSVKEWPDAWDSGETYVYFGDQREAGLDVLDTPRGGNRLLAEVASKLTYGKQGRASVPPFLLFEKDGRGRDVRFEGLLVPASDDDWLTVEQRSTAGGVLSNYCARLTPIGLREVSRLWLSDILRGCPIGASAPPSWIRWVESGSAE